MVFYRRSSLKKTIIRIFLPKNYFYIKNLMWYSHNFLLPCITIEEYFIFSITFIFNLHIPCFVADELPASIIIVYNF